MSETSVKFILDKFSHQHLLVLGDVMLDRYILGETHRISPEAPIPVFHQKHVNNRLGGAGNVVRSLRALGAKASIISVVGQDPEAELVHSLFADQEVNTCSLIKDADRKTSLKTRYVAHNQQLMRVDCEETHDITCDIEKSVMTTLEHLIPEIHGVILSDYAKGFLTDALCAKVINVCRHHNLPVFVDPKAQSFKKYAGATWITPNRHELITASKETLHTDEDFKHVCRRLIKECDFQGILATRSEQGMSVITDDLCHHLKAQVLDVFDVSGAGDTVLALFSLSLTAGAPAPFAADISNHGAGVVVAKSGTATVTPAELLAHKDTRPFKIKEKYGSLAYIQEKIFEWRRHSLTIGFTNGCFDILHPGHILLLQNAKKRCDRLIVAINSDDSIKRLKGPERPIHDLSHRAQVLQALGCVDAIVAFEEDTPLQLLLELKPHVLFKGADYAMDQVIGAQEIQNWGGWVELLDLMPGHSTTLTVKKLKRYSMMPLHA